MLKKILSTLFCLILLISQNLAVVAQTYKIPAGTPITVYAAEEIDADDVQLDQNIDFIVQDPVYINNKLVIKSGTSVIGQVVKLKNNSILGISGEIQIGNFRLANSNQVINLRGNITNKGTNRTWVNVGWFFGIALPLLFVKGNDGKIPAGTYQILYTIGDNFINSDL